jgi:peptidoglycan LD-endopeptidase CwlK
MKSFYFDVIRGDELPPPLAAMTYNAAILSGPKRGITFLQKALNRQGASLEEDGRMGKLTLEAAQAASPRLVASVYADVQEAYLRSLPHFPTFGKGWLRRLDAFRQLAKTIPLAATVATPADTSPDETRGGSPMPVPTDTAANVVMAFEALQKALREAQMQTQAPAPSLPPPIASTPDIFSQIQQMLEIMQGKPAKSGLGPVNGALGDTIGNLLNGRKSAIGITGALLAAMTQPGGLLAALPAMLGVSAGTVSGLLPVFLALAAWGGLGKAEKWMGGSR